MNADPAVLCLLSMPADVAAIDWQEVDGPSGVDVQWHGDGGEVLTLFPPEARTVGELLDADAAALLVGGTFRPGAPMREGDRLHGCLTESAPAGPARLDVAALVGPDGTRRLVLLRPLPPG